MIKVFRELNPVLQYLEDGYELIECPLDFHAIDEETADMLYVMTSGRSHTYIVCKDNYDDLNVVDIKVAYKLIENSIVIRHRIDYKARVFCYKHKKYYYR